MKKKIFKTKEEMIKGLESVRRETLSELNEGNMDFIKDRKHKTIKFTVIFLVIFVLFKLFIGELNITLNNNNPFSLYKNKLYIVELNSEAITIEVEEYKKNTIIPFVLNLNIYSNHIFYNNDKETYIKHNLGDHIFLDIKAFECYYMSKNNKNTTTCAKDYDSLLKEEINDIEYNMLIKSTRKGEKVAYSGKFIQDISEYLTEKGQFSVRITAMYNNVKSDINFLIKIV